MSDQPKPNIAASLLTIHAVVTQALRVSIESVQSLSQLGFPDTPKREGYLNNVRAYPP